MAETTPTTEITRTAGTTPKAELRLRRLLRPRELLRRRNSRGGNDSNFGNIEVRADSPFELSLEAVAAGVPPSEQFPTLGAASQSFQRRSRNPLIGDDSRSELVLRHEFVVAMRDVNRPGAE